MYGSLTLWIRVIDDYIAEDCGKTASCYLRSTNAYREPFISYINEKTWQFTTSYKDDCSKIAELKQQISQKIILVRSTLPKCHCPYNTLALPCQRVIIYSFIKLVWHTAASWNRRLKERSKNEIYTTYMKSKISVCIHAPAGHNSHIIQSHGENRRGSVLEWLGHTLRSNNSMVEQSLQWTLQGYRRRRLQYIYRKERSRERNVDNRFQMQPRKCWRQQQKTELDRGEWSVACAALGATSDKSIKYSFYVLLINRNVQNVYS